MSCPSISCLCSRCSQLRRHAYREGLADAHRVFIRRGKPLPPAVQVSPGVLADLLPALERLEWSGERELVGGVITAACCPECGSKEVEQTHTLDCGLRELLSLARVARYQPDLFAVRT